MFFLRIHRGGVFRSASVQEGGDSDKAAGRLGGHFFREDRNRAAVPGAAVFKKDIETGDRSVMLHPHEPMTAAATQRLRLTGEARDRHTRSRNFHRPSRSKAHARLLLLRARSQFGFLSSEPNLLDLRIEAVTDVEAATSMSITVEAKLNNPNGNVKLRLRNWDTNALTQVHEYILGTTETIEVANVTKNADVYVRDGDGMIELSIKQVVIATFSTSGFVASFDRVAIGVE